MAAVAALHCGLPLIGLHVDGTAGLDASPDGPQSGLDASTSSVDGDAEAMDARMDAPGDSAHDTGVVDAADAADGSCGADLTSDSHNCGRCGHNCLGSSCVSSLCQPIPVAIAAQPRWITLDATHVYFTNFAGGTVERVAKDGTNPVFVAIDQGGPSYIAIDATNVYWTNETTGSIRMAPKTDVSGSGTQIGGSTGAAPTGIAVDSVNVYWGESGTGALIGESLGGEVGNPLGAPGVLDVRADGAHVYYVAGREVRRTDPSLGDSNVVVIAPAATHNSPFAIALDASHVYWTEEGTTPAYQDGAVMRANLDGTMVTPIATGLKRPHGIAVDESYVYWTSPSDLSVMRAPITGGAPTNVATMQGTPFGVAVDATYVYWTNQVGSVVKVAK